MSRSKYRWLFILPSFAVGVAVTIYFWNYPPTSDGGIYLTHAEEIWRRPFSFANFTLRPSDFRYFSMGLLGLTYQLGVPSLDALKLLQVLLYFVALASLYDLCLELFPRISSLEAGLSVLIFAVCPAYLAYLVGVALDFIALSFHLLYLLLIMRRRWWAASLSAIALAFSKESGFFVYAATLPVALWWSSTGSGKSWGAQLLRPLPLFAPLLLHFLLLGVRQRSLMAVTAAAPECGATGWALVLSPNLCRREIHCYLFNLFALNFQWLLLIPIALGALRLSINRRLAREVLRYEVDVRKFTLVVLFLLAWVWAFTRCPLYNNVKYVLNAMPLWLLVSLVFARAAFPAPWMRVPFLLMLLLSFGVSAVMSIDPLSRQFYGLMRTDGRPMLCMASRLTGPADCGNDEIIYNLQRFL